MTNKQALREEFRNMQDHYSDPADRKQQEIYIAAEALLDELEAKDKLIAELESEKSALRPVGVMSEKAFHRLEGSEARFIALWPRPGIYLPRKRPEDGVIVYARTAGRINGEG